MADNVQITAGTGTTIRTDDIGSGVQVQFVKIMDGTDGGSQPVPATTANGLLVDVSQIQGVVDTTGSVVDITGSSVVVSGSALPTGAATEATLAILDGKVTACNTGAVVIASGVITTVSAVTAITNALPAGNNNIGDVDVASLPTLNIVDVSGTISLPTGAATEVTLAALNTKVTAVNTGAVVISGALPAGNNNIGDVDIASSALPTGAATESTLSTLNGKVTACNTGAVVVASGTLTTVSTVTAVTTVSTVTAVTAITNALPAGNNNIGDVDVASLPALAAGNNNIGDVDVATLPALPSGTNNIGDVDVLTLPGIAGDVAHDSADSGNPVKIGFKAISHGTNPTGVTANDRTHGYANVAGIPFQLGGHPNTICKEFEFTSAQNDQALITVSGGTKIVVVGIHATVDHATSVDVGVRVGFSAATLSAASSSGIAGILLSHPGIQAGGGVAVGNGGGILGIGADGEDLRITSEAATSGALRVVVQYFTIES